MTCSPLSSHKTHPAVQSQPHAARPLASAHTHTHTGARGRSRVKFSRHRRPATGAQTRSSVLGARCSVFSARCTGARLGSLSRQAELDGRTVGIVGQLNGRAVGHTGTMGETLPLSPVYWFGAARWRVKWPSRGAHGPGVTSEGHQW